jgi:Trk K+ transport system NAD-binding subunit
VHDHPLILIVGGDALTRRVSAELTATAGHEVRIVWPVSTESDAALIAAGVETATAILALSSDDAENLAIALRARMLNPSIRVVLRQFDPILGSKIEQNLADCTALSAAAHSAATYAGAALDRDCVFALRFPARTGPLLGFTRTPAAALGVADTTVADAEARLGKRILALGDRREPSPGAMIAPDDLVTVFGAVSDRDVHHPHVRGADSGARRALRIDVRALIAAWLRLNPVLRVFVLAAVGFFSFEFMFFHLVLHKTWTAASFYVVETMTNVGFGDTAVTTKGPLGAHARAVERDAGDAAHSRARPRRGVRRRQDRECRDRLAHRRGQTRRRHRVETGCRTHPACARERRRPAHRRRAA